MVTSSQFSATPRTQRAAVTRAYHVDNHTRHCTPFPQHAIQQGRHHFAASTRSLTSRPSTSSSINSSSMALQHQHHAATMAVSVPCILSSHAVKGSAACSTSTAIASCTAIQRRRRVWHSAQPAAHVRCHAASGAWSTGRDDSSAAAQHTMRQHIDACSSWAALHSLLVHQHALFTSPAPTSSASSALMDGHHLAQLMSRLARICRGSHAHTDAAHDSRTQHSSLTAPQQHSSTPSVQQLSATLPVISGVFEALAPTIRPAQLATCMWALAVMAEGLPAHVRSSISSFPSLTPSLRQADRSRNANDTADHDMQEDAVDVAGDMLWSALQHDHLDATQSSMRAMAVPPPVLQWDTQQQPSFRSTTDDLVVAGVAGAGGVGSAGLVSATMQGLLTCLLSEKQLSKARARDLVQALYAHAKLGLAPYRRVCRQTRALDSSAGGSNTHTIHDGAEAQAQKRETKLVPALRSILRALAPPAVYKMSAQDCSLAVWSLATLAGSPSGAGYSLLAPIGRERDENGRRVSAWLDQVCEVSRRQLPVSFKTQALANMAWGLAVLKHVPGAQWVRVLLRASGERLHECTSQELSNLAWAMPHLLNVSTHGSAVPQIIAMAEAHAWAQRVDYELARRLLEEQVYVHVEKQAQGSLAMASGVLQAALAPQHVACVLRCMALLQHPPSSALMQALEQYLMQHPPNLPSSSAFSSSFDSSSSQPAAPDALPSRLTQPALGLSRNTHKPHVPSWATDLQAQCTVLWSLSRLPSCPSPRLVRALSQALGAQLPRATAADLAGALHALALLHHPPDTKWLVRFFQASERVLPRCTSAQLGALLLGLARVRVRPDRAWMERAMGLVVQRTQHFVQLAALDRNHALAQSTLTHAGVYNRISNLSSSSGSGTDRGGAYSQQEEVLSYDAASGPRWRCAPRDLASLWGALGRLDYCPPASCVGSLCGAAEGQVGGFTALELNMMLCAQAKLGLVEGGFVPARMVSGKVHAEGSGEGGLQAFVKRRPHLPAGWVASMRRAVAQRSWEFGPQQLHATLQALTSMSGAGAAGKAQLEWVGRAGAGARELEQTYAFVSLSLLIPKRLLLQRATAMRQLAAAHMQSRHQKSHQR